MSKSFWFYKGRGMLGASSEFLIDESRSIDFPVVEKAPSCSMFVKISKS